MIREGPYRSPLAISDCNDAESGQTHWVPQPDWLSDESIAEMIEDWVLLQVVLERVDEDVVPWPEIDED